MEMCLLTIFETKWCLLLYWIKAKAVPNLTANFKVSAEAKNPDTGFMMMFTGKVHPIDMPVEEIMKTGHYLMMNRQHVDQLKFESGQAGKDKGFSIQIKLDFTIENVTN